MGFSLLLIPLLLMSAVQVSANNRPQFGPTPNVIIPEDTPIGAHIFNITATDPDRDILTYGIEGPDSYYFSCAQDTGEVALAVSVDYEIKNLLSITLTVTDGITQTVTKNIVVTVTDCNDNTPIFEGTPYFATVKENTTPGTIILNVTAKDYDDNGKAPVSFEIIQITPNIPGSHLFYIKREAETSPTVGNIYLNDTLNYNKLSTFYQLSILAKDRGGQLNGVYIEQNSTVYVSVNVVDVPDLNPEFIGAPYVISVQEHTGRGEVVQKVSAIDADRGIDDKILYSIISSTVGGLFSINESTGEIHVINDIDREKLLDNDEQVILTVMAKEQNLNIHGQPATATTTVTIRVLDINDNKPQFYNCEVTDCNFQTDQSNFYGEIEEHSSVRVPVANLTITANDPDKDQNGAFNLYLRGKDADYFTVSPTRVTNTGLVQVLVKNPEAIDYEKVQKMYVEIVANDTRKITDCCSVASVTIQLIDINDHIPEFPFPLYDLKVKEHCANGTSLGRITATDPDSEIYGLITYGLLPPSILNSFNVNTATGEITVVNGDLLDRERLSQYYATLQARDGINATGTTLLEITLIDINDWPPEATGTYNIFVNENSDDVHIEITAFDNDEPGNSNSMIRFRLLPSYLSGNFSINSITGVITSNGPLDREEIDITLNGRIVLTVELYDLGVPSLSSEVIVTINVEDLNDNAPVFTQEEYRFFVNESTEGVYVGSLSASDADQTELNNRISFRISQGGSGNFIIRGQQVDLGQYIGQLFLDPEVQLDYEQQKNYTLIIEAQDYGFKGVSNSANAAVIVEVLDLNDEPPYINPTTLVDLYVVEKWTGVPEKIAQLNATDPDTNSDLEFQSLSVTCYKNSKDAGSICYNWLWLAPDGQLFVSYTEDVDYELCDRIDMLLRVEDKLTLLGDRYSNNDKDSGQNAELFFSIEKVDFIFSTGGDQQLGNLFSVVTINENNIYVGSVRSVTIITLIRMFSLRYIDLIFIKLCTYKYLSIFCLCRVASNLDRTLKGQYNVTVRVMDKGNPPLNATRSITIFTIDESYRSILRFSRSVDEVTEQIAVIMGQLSLATGASVFVSGIEPEEDTSRIYSRASKRSILSVYCVFANGTAITPDELSSKGTAEGPLQQGNKILYGIIAGLAAVLIVLAISMTISLVCMRKSHKRKLRAVKASKVAKALPGEAAQGVEAIPGTNRFNKDGANPMLNVDMGNFLDLGFEENSSVSDSVR
uniref:Cadherin domain-containing protein n=1 Tax=Pyxicephalus adspersus TaxID=30357 RepID=A0AAV3APB6_PYXAD|nr:TPA: hypothetical protein GDO54_006850 [Pyxicephalus adspersus]